MKICETIFIFCGLIFYASCEVEVDPRITGGQIASLGQFPHHVLIGKTRLQFTDFCSGSLIRFNWVLTSASCVSDFYSISLQFGIVNRTSQATWESTIIEPTHVRIHQKFNPTTLENNIALIFIEHAQPSLISSPNVGVVNLPLDSNDLAGVNATVSGFGWINATAGRGSNDLMFITVPILSNSACPSVNNTNLCVNTTGGKSTCNEDRGSGLISTISGTITLVGVASKDDCNLSQPALFTRVSSFLDWINQTIAQMTTTTTFSPSPTQSTTTENSSMRNFSNLFIIIFSLAFTL